MDHIHHSFITIGEVKLHIAEIGTGSTAVVFLHGFPEIWYSWRHQMVAAAAAGYRAIAPDLRGYGFSESHPHPQNASFEDFVEDIVGILDFLHIPKAFLIAKDFGSWVAYLFSLLLPARVAGIVSLGVPFLPPNPKRYRDLPEGFYIFRWKVWLYETIPLLSGRAAKRLSNDAFPRMLRWTSSHSTPTKKLIKEVFTSPQESGRAEADFGRFDVKTVLSRIYTLFSKSEIPIAQKDQEIMDMMDESTPRPPWLTDEDLAVYTTLYEHSGFESALQVPYRRKHKELSISNPKVEVPVLLIIGGKDYFLKFRGIEDSIKSGKMREFMADLEVVDLAYGTHFMQEQFPQQVNQLLITFLTKHVI